MPHLEESTAIPTIIIKWRTLHILLLAIGIDRMSNSEQAPIKIIEVIARIMDLILMIVMEVLHSMMMIIGEGDQMDGMVANEAMKTSRSDQMEAKEHQKIKQRGMQ